MNTYSIKLAAKIVQDIESEVGELPCGVKAVMLDAYSKEISKAKSGFSVIATFHDRNRKKGFEREYKISQISY